MSEVPILFDWDGEAMVPASPHWAKRCDEQFVVGEKYRLAIHEERSANSHNHYHAAVHDAWMNLPEELAAQYPTPEKLRKHALIKAGFANTREVVFETPEDALRAAAFARALDDYAVVTVRENVVTMYTAKSQTYRAMNKDDFQASKQAVLDILEGFIGAEPGDLRREAGQAA